MKKICREGVASSASSKVSGGSGQCEQLSVWLPAAANQLAPTSGIRKMKEYEHRPDGGGREDRS